MMIGYTRTITGWANITTAAGTRYNVRGDLFIAVTSADKRAQAGYIGITAEQLSELKADRWTRRLNTEGAQAI